MPLVRILNATGGVLRTMKLEECDTRAYPEWPARMAKQTRSAWIKRINKEDADPVMQERYAVITYPETGK